MIPSQVREYIKRRQVVGDWETQADAVSDMLGYASEAEQPEPMTPEEPAIVAPESSMKRRPLVAASDASAQSGGDPVREYVKRRLAEESMVPVEADPALVSKSTMSQHLNNLINTGLSLGGLPATHKAVDYATPDLERRRAVQEWVAKQQARKDDLALKGLGLDSEAAQNQYNLGELERRKAADKARGELEAQRLKLLEAQLGAKKTDADRRAIERAAEAKRRTHEAEQKAVKMLEGSKISYFDSIYAPIAKQAPSETMQNKARDFLAKSATAVKAIAEFRKKLNAAISSPVAGGARQQALAELGSAATSLNAFLGQGAMAEGEFERVKQSLGKVGGLDFLVDAANRWVSGDDSALSGALSRTDATLDLVRKITDETVKPLGYLKEGASNAAQSTWPVGEIRTDKNGRRLRKREDGKFEVMP